MLFIILSFFIIYDFFLSFACFWGTAKIVIIIEIYEMIWLWCVWQRDRNVLCG